MSYSVTSGFISTLYGINGAPPTISDAELAKLLQPYLGTLSAAPFTKNMPLAARDAVLGFLNYIDPNLAELANDNKPVPESETMPVYLPDGTLVTDALQSGANVIKPLNHGQIINSSIPSTPQTGDLQTLLNNLIKIAQTPQTEEAGQPAPIPPDSGGLARNTASALGSLIASLIEKGVLIGSAGIYTTDESKLADWQSEASSHNFVAATFQQLNQDIPTSTVSILLSNQTTATQVTIPLNQSLQEMLETQYVQTGSNIIFGGLQSLYTQQQEAGEALGQLSQLQQVYNGIIPVDIPTSVKTFSDPSALQSALYDIVNGIMNEPGVQGDGINVYYNAFVSGNVATIDWDIVNNNNLYGTGSVVTSNGTITYTTNADGSISQSQSLGSADTSSLRYNSVTQLDPNNASQSNNTFLDIANDVAALGTVTSAGQTTSTVSDIINNLAPGDPGQYVRDLSHILPTLFPQPGATTVNNIQVNGQALSLAAGGSMQQLLNGLYQSYLLQSAQRLITADPNILTNPNTGDLYVNPAVKESDLAAYDASRKNLAIIKGIRDAAEDLITASNPAGTTNLIVPLFGETGTAPIITYIDPTTQQPTNILPTDFGTATGGSLEDNIRTVLQNLVSGVVIFGGDGTTTSPPNQYIFTELDGDLNISNWILGNWPTGTSDTPRLTGVALDQTQSYLSNAFSAASSLNDALQQELKQSFFLFQEFVQSATSVLSAINIIITKMAQNISSR